MPEIDENEVHRNPLLRGSYDIRIGEQLFLGLLQVESAHPDSRLGGWRPIELLRLVVEAEAHQGSLLGRMPSGGATSATLAAWESHEQLTIAGPDERDMGNRYRAVLSLRTASQGEGRSPQVWRSNFRLACETLTARRGSRKLD